MTETQAPTVAVVNFDPASADHVAALAAMFRDYLLEELDRLGHFASGLPLANWLNTFIVYVGETPAGFCSADTTRYAIELVYVRPAYRRHGIARQMLTELRDSCPETMHVKLPLSPGGQAVAERLGIPTSAPTEAEEIKGKKAIAELHETIAKRCTHRRPGDPRRTCRRCYRALLKKAAVAMVVDPCIAVRGLGRKAA